MGKVLVIIGSESDRKLLGDIQKIFNDSGVQYDIEVASCHRNLDALYNLMGKLKSDKKYSAIIRAEHMAPPCCYFLARQTEDVMVETEPLSRFLTLPWTHRPTGTHSIGLRTTACWPP